MDVWFPRKDLECTAAILGRHALSLLQAQWLRESDKAGQLQVRLCCGGASMQVPAACPRLHALPDQVLLLC
jgi:hypothetical protein